jgi:hypothetical protein
MADYYTKYSFLVPIPDSFVPVATFIVEHIYDFQEYYQKACDVEDEKSSLQEYIKDALIDDAAYDSELWTSVVVPAIDVILKMELNPDYFELPEHLSIDNSAGNYTYNKAIWLSDCEGPSTEFALEFTKAILKGYNAPIQDSIIASLSFDCSKPRLDAYGGSSFLITTDKIYEFIPERDAIDKYKELILRLDPELRHHL